MRRAPSRPTSASPLTVAAAVLERIAAREGGKALVQRIRGLAAGRSALESEEKRDLEKDPRLEARITHHKRRTYWFRERAAWPGRDAPIQQLIEERARVSQQLSPQAAIGAWQLAGPVNVGGRMTCVSPDPRDTDSVIAGAAGGGLWSSVDAGRTWQPLWHAEDSLNIGSLARDPSDPNVVYCGTGEANLSADSYGGAGIYRSTDGGSTWSLIASSTSGDVPIRIGAIAVNPNDSSHLVLGGVGHYHRHDEHPGGLYVSTDGGANWARDTSISAFHYWCHAVLFDPTLPGRLYATITERGTRNGIWRSSDDGATWQQLLKGLPRSETMERTSLALAPSSTEVLYAQVSSSRRKVLGVFRSGDHGDNWTAIHGAHFANERQMKYNNTIVVHPDDSDHVLCAGVDVHRSTDGGSSWSRVTSWRQPRGHPSHAHADHHALVMPGGDRVYSMNDGGMDVSEDGGSTWANRSVGLSTTMYYDLDVSQADPLLFGGGCQDNGTQITTTGADDDHFDITGGDGGWLVFDPQDANHIIASVYNMNIQRWRGGWTDISPPEHNSVRERVWMCYIAMDPSDSNVLFTGSHRVWRSTNDGTNWTDVSGSLDGSVITAIEIAPSDPMRLYVGTNNGGIFRSNDGGTTWSGDLAGGALPGFQITRLRCRPTDADAVLVTIANFGHSHVFRSRDGGDTWQDVDGGRLPDLPHHGIAIPRAHPDEVYVCGDGGVFTSPDFGTNWLALSGGLPNVSVVDVVYHDGEDTLTAATYGRSLWKLQVR